MYLVILPDQQEENMSQEQQPTDKTGVLNENLLFFVYLSIHSIIFILFLLFLSYWSSSFN